MNFIIHLVGRKEIIMEGELRGIYNAIVELINYRRLCEISDHKEVLETIRQMLDEIDEMYDNIG